MTEKIKELVETIVKDMDIDSTGQIAFPTKYEQEVRLLIQRLYDDIQDEVDGFLLNYD